jgi:hypothetical protein
MIGGKRKFKTKKGKFKTKEVLFYMNGKSAKKNMGGVKMSRSLGGNVFRIFFVSQKCVLFPRVHAVLYSIKS